MNSKGSDRNRKDPPRKYPGGPFGSALKKSAIEEFMYKGPN